MDIAEILSIIVERACSYIPDVPVGESRIRKRPAPSKIDKVSKGPLTDGEKVSKEAFTVDVNVPIEERTSVEKKVLVSSDFVRF